MLQETRASKSAASALDALQEIFCQSFASGKPIRTPQNQAKTIKIHQNESKIKLPGRFFQRRSLRPPLVGAPEQVQSLQALLHGAVIVLGHDAAGGHDVQRSAHAALLAQPHLR